MGSPLRLDVLLRTEVVGGDQGHGGDADPRTRLAGDVGGDRQLVLEHWVLPFWRDV